MEINYSSNYPPPEEIESTGLNEFGESADDVEVEYRILFSAQLGLVKNTDFTAYPLSHFKNRVSAAELSRMDARIREVNLPADMLRYFFDNIIECRTHYRNGRVFLSARVMFKGDPLAMQQKEQISELMDDYVSSFTDMAGDSYLTRDAVIYTENSVKKIGGNVDRVDNVGEFGEMEESTGDEGDDDVLSYELVLDDIRLFVYDREMVTRLYEKKIEKFWFH
jgi:hypothetical protein